MFSQNQNRPSKYKNNIPISINWVNPVILEILDLSTALYTVSYNLTFSWLKDLFGSLGKISYFEQSSPKISIDGIFSGVLFCYLVFDGV